MATPLVSIKIEYLVLLIMRTKDVDHNPIASMGFQSRCCRICVCSNTGCEHVTEFTTFVLSIKPRLEAIVNTRQARYVLQVRHERCTNDVIFILKIQRKVSIIIDVSVFRIRFIDNNVRSPGITQ